MNASPIQDSTCRECGEKLASGVHYCSNCGAPAGELPPLETVPGPVVHENAEPRRLGMPARFVLLCLGFAALGAAIGLFATANWAWGVVLLLLAVVTLTALGEAARRSSDAWMEQSSRPAAEGRSHAATTAAVWRTRLDSTLTRWRTRSRLDAIAHERSPAFQALGEAVWRGDTTAEREARARLVELEQEAKRIEDELAERLAGADERIRNARLPVQDTERVTPNAAGSGGGQAAARPEDPGPSAPYPPPDEGNPPEPAQVPEPYPPPDEGTPPVPAPDPGQTENE